MYYTVQPGDTLSGIAMRFGVPIQEIIRANNLREPFNVFAGQTLFIPVLRPPGPPGPPRPPGPPAPPRDELQRRVERLERRMDRVEVRVNDLERRVRRLETGPRPFGT